jgi:tight adherence protein B
MHDNLLLILVAGACIALMGLGLSATLVSRGQRERDKRAERLAAIVTPQRKSRVELSAFTPAVETRNTSIRGIITLVFGFDQSKSAMYPMNGWVAIMLALGIGKVGQVLLSYLVSNLLSLPAIPVIWVLLSRNFFSWAQQRHQNALLVQFPDALAMLVRSVRVGIPVLEAIRAVSREAPAPTGPEFARLMDQISIGVALEDAVVEMSERAGIAEYRFFATTLALQTQTGGTLSETLESLADVIRKRQALKSRGKALTAEARASAAILGALPFVSGIMLYFINPDYIGLLFTDSTGNMLFGGAVVSLGTGMLVIRALIRSALT